jgi:hypothetical protein
MWMVRRNGKHDTRHKLDAGLDWTTDRALNYSGARLNWTCILRSLADDGARVDLRALPQ